MKDNIQIAIDGPAGSGKGTLALILAKKLNAIHIYTGGMYRALALYCLRNKLDISNEEDVVAALENIEIDLKTNSDSTTRIILNNEDITEDITLIEVSNAVPVVSKYEKVRVLMVKKQRQIADGKKSIMEGRDIATVVLPNADLKIFLDADVDIRAQRRFDQLKDKNPNISIEDIKRDVTERDRKDEQRSFSPLKPTEDSFIIDTTNDKVGDTVEKVMSELKNRRLL